MTSSIRCALWDKHHQHEDVRQLLLRLIWLGPLRACADFAVDFAFGRFTDKSTQLFAGLALLKAADDAARRRYAEYVVASCADLPTMVVWNCVDDLFPRALDVDDLITILSRVDVIDREGGLSFDSHGASLLARLTSRPDLERLLQRLLEMAGPRRREGRREERPKVFLPALSGGAFHLLQLCPPGETPNIAIDCVLRVGDDRQDKLLMREGQGDPAEVLQRTAIRRQAVFWRAANVLREHPQVRGQGITDLWEIVFLGWAPTLGIEDLDWLLADGPRRSNPSDRTLAINVAMSVWRDNGSQTPILPEDWKKDDKPMPLPAPQTIKRGSTLSDACAQTRKSLGNFAHRRTRASTHASTIFGNCLARSSPRDEPDFPVASIG